MTQPAKSLSGVLLCLISVAALSQQAFAIPVQLLSVQNSTDLSLTPPGSSEPGVNAHLEEHFWFVRGSTDEAYLTLGPHVDFPSVSRIAKARFTFEDIDIVYGGELGVMIFDFEWSLGPADPVRDVLMLPAGGINEVLADEGSMRISIPVADVAECSAGVCSISFDLWYVDSDVNADGTGLNNFDDGSSQAGSAWEASNFNVFIAPEPSAFLMIVVAAAWFCRHGRHGDVKTSG